MLPRVLNHRNAESSHRLYSATVASSRRKAATSGVPRFVALLVCPGTIDERSKVSWGQQNRKIT